ncbi:MAG: cotI 1 [Bacilli bacterium]|nr:cotI 1 [Bacilli bacterium]
MDPSLLKQVEKMYHLQVVSAQPVDSLYKTEAIYKLHTSEGVKALKEFHFSEDELRFVTSIMLSLYKAGADVVRPIRTKDRELYLKVGKRLLYLTDWAPGSRFDGAVLDDVDQVSKSIANMHLLASDFQFHKLPYRRRYQLNLLVDSEKRLHNFTRSIRKLSVDDPLARELTRHASIYIEQGERALAAMKQLPLQLIAEEEIRGGQIIHRDLTCPNLLISTAGAWILDFDLCTYGSCSSDLATFMANTLGWSIPAGTRAWRSYLEVHPLSIYNKRLTICQMMLPREAWELVRKYDVQDNKTNRSGLDQLLERFHALLNTQAQKENFLAHFCEQTDDL